jgi:dienelactone hydrolase
MRNRTFCFPLLVILGLAQLGMAQPFALGNRSETWQDASRNRNVTFDIWYPSTSGGQGSAVAQGQFPVFILSHGFLTGTGPYKNMVDSLVPLGYIMVLPSTETGFLPSHEALGRDMVFLGQRIQQENQNSNSYLFGKVSAAMAAGGHSMGGGATFLAASYAPTLFATTVTFAAAETNPSAAGAASQVSTSCLLLIGSDDGVTPLATHQQPIYNNLSNCKVMVSIQGGGHCYFMNADAACDAGELLTPPSIANRAEQHRRTFRVVRPWLDHFLKGQPAAAVLQAINNASPDALTQNCNYLGSETIHLTHWVQQNGRRWTWNQSGLIYLELFDLQGRLVFQKNGAVGEGEVWELPSEATGLMVARFSVDGTVGSEKVWLP